MIIAALLSASSVAGDIAISPLTMIPDPWSYTSYDLPCPYPVGNSLLFEGRDIMGNSACTYGQVLIPLTPFPTGRNLVSITVCYETRFAVGSVSPGISLEISESIGAAQDAVLWTDGVSRTSNPGVCEVIPVGVFPTGTPMLKIAFAQDGDVADEDTYIGQIWMTVGK